MTPKTIKQVVYQYSKGNDTLMRAGQRRLDEATGVQTVLMLNSNFLRKHPASSEPFEKLFNIVADCVKTVIQKKLVAAAYPIHRGDDGSFQVIDIPTVITSSTLDDMASQDFGAKRLGIAVTCGSVDPLGYEIAVGPFWELLEQVQEAVGAIEE